MQASLLRVALIPHSFTEDVEASRSQLEAGIRYGTEAGARLVILPEPRNSRYFRRRRGRRQPAESTWQRKIKSNHPKTVAYDKSFVPRRFAAKKAYLV